MFVFVYLFCLFVLVIELTQFDLSDDELHLLQTKRWNFSSSTTRISDISADDADPSARHQVLTSDDCGPDSQPGRVTIADLYRKLSGTIGVMPASRPAALRLNSESEGAVFTMDSPLPLETPSPAILPDVYSSSPLGSSGQFDKFWKEDMDHSVKMSVDLVVPQGEGRSASVEKERTRMREEEENDGVNGEESRLASRRNCEEDSLGILGLVSLTC